MNKIGVNEPCPCGSGIKFKKCCSLKGIVYIEDFENIKRSLLEAKNTNANFNVYNGLLVGNPIIHARLRNIRGILVGSGYYVRDFRESFHEFLIHQLKHGLGWLWGTNESQKILDQKHIYLRWLNSFATLVKDNTKQSNKLRENLYSVEMNGDAQMLLLFAYDIFTLRNANQLPIIKIKELRDWNKFQSTRYEIAVAAIFVRAGFTLEWFDDKATTRKHCEFTATHLITGEKIGVEVKSRYRSGTYHSNGIITMEQVKTGAKSKLIEAYQQLPDNLASMVFVDLNLPMNNLHSDFNKGIPNELMHVFDEFPKPSKDNPSPCNATVFTNWSWHYFGKNQVKTSVTSIKTFPIYVKFPLSSNVMNLLNKAIEEYNIVPFPVFE